MYRTLLTTALVAMLSLTGCGGGSKDSENSNAGGGGKTFNKASTLPAEQQAQMAMKIDIGSAMKHQMVAEALEKVGTEDIPAFVMKATMIDVAVNFPGEFGMDVGAKINFAINVGFSDEASAKAALEEMLKDAPDPKDEKIGDVDFKVVTSPGGPVVCAAAKGDTLMIMSRAYAESGTDAFASDALRGIMNSLEGNNMMSVGFDMKGASGFLKGASAMAGGDPMVSSMVEAFLKVDSMKMTSGVNDPLFMMSFEAADEDSIKAVHQTLQKGLALAMGGLAMVTPDEGKAPAAAEMFSHLQSNLSPKREGNVSKIVIPKPDNYEELTKKMAEEFKSGAALPAGLMPGGPGSAPKGGEFKKEDFKKE